MIIIKKIGELQDALDMERSKKKIGLVPTMGALHKGHLSLIEAAVKNNHFIVTTIFVNPTQFNDPADLERYPRDLDKDLALLDQYPVDIVFVPDVKEMYPSEDTRKFDLAPLDSVMEGAHRPGHFNGVAQIVSKLFYAVKPDIAYFGEKDFQQLLIIRKLVKMLDLDITIVSCPIIREEDGLAMSSRNQLLSEEGRKAAPLINKTLSEATRLKDTHTPDEITAHVVQKLNSHPLLNVEYFEIVDDQMLRPVHDWNEPGNKVGCIAVHIGKVRLIDNRFFA